MNAGRAIRRLEEAGFTHDQATGMVEILQEEAIDTLATKDHVKATVELAVERGKNSIILWMVGLVFAQFLGQTSLILIVGNILWGQ
jgi:hypothetical protein